MEKNNIDILKLKLDVEIIKPYLISKGYDFNTYSNYDQFAYHVARKGDIRYLAFGISRYQGNYFGEQDYKYEFGQIIYDINGNVLLDCINTDSDKCFFWRAKKETYEEVDSSNIFMDDIALITKLDYYYVPGSFATGNPRYSIYKFENNKYSLVGELNELRTEVEKTSTGELFINCDGRLYGVRELKFLNDLEFEDIIGVNRSRSIGAIKKISSNEIEDKIISILKNNNLLFAYDYVYSDLWYEKPNDATVFVFLDTEGNIASKLFVKKELDFYSMEVDNSTYEQAIELCKQKLNDDVRRKLEQERRKQKRELNLQCKSNKKMLEELSNSFDDIIEPQGVVKTLKPSNNKHK